MQESYESLILLGKAGILVCSRSPRRATTCPATRRASPPKNNHLLPKKTHPAGAARTKAVPAVCRRSQHRRAGHLPSASRALSAQRGACFLAGRRRGRRKCNFCGSLVFFKALGAEKYGTGMAHPSSEGGRCQKRGYLPSSRGLLAGNAFYCLSLPAARLNAKCHISFKKCVYIYV